jgi:hypothetical protein
VRITISLERSDCRAWLRDLAAMLEREGHAIAFAVQGGDAPDRQTEMLLACERLVYGGTRGAFALIDPDTLPRGPGGEPDLRIALSGLLPGQDALVVRVDGAPGVGRIAPALVAGHVPFIEIIDAAGMRHAAGLPATEQPDILGRSLDQITTRLATLIGMAIDGVARYVPPDESPERTPSGSPLGFGIAGFAGRIGARLTGRAGKAEHWRVGIRPRRAGDVDGDRAIEGFRLLADDGARYYADPILWEEGGADFLFVEEFPYALGRGIIAVAELDPAGRPRAQPSPIIERDGHLSYPFLFRHAGAIYMIPENAAEGHVPLYRARSFPQDWEFVGALIAEPLHDATLVASNGAYWLLGNATPHGGSSWDCLAIFRADHPLGPFVPHRANPVLVDARIARSAGPVLEANGRLIRPVQSCLGGYGRFLRFCEITALDEERFDQRQCGRLVAPLGGPIGGVHTYSRSRRFEAIDALTPRGFDIDRFNADR